MRDLKIELSSGSLTGIESSGTGPVLVLCHGNSTGAEMFRPLLASELGRRFRMLALDLPGHGGSYRSSNPEREYTIPRLARVLVNAICALDLKDYTLLGHSLGGHLVSSALSQLSGARGVFLVSAPPLGAGSLEEVFRPDPTGGALFKEALNADEVRRFGRALVEPGAVPVEAVATLEKCIRDSDPRFRASLGASVGAGLLENEALALAKTTLPTLLVRGSEDRFLRADYYERVKLKTPWREGNVSFEGSGHAPHLDSPAKFVTLLGAFLSDGLR